MDWLDRRVEAIYNETLLAMLAGWHQTMPAEEGLPDDLWPEYPKTFWQKVGFVTGLWP